MKDSYRIWVLIGIVVALICAGLFILVRSKNPQAPPVPVISDCKPLATGMRRVGSGPGIQFDVLTSGFRISEGATDAAPFIHGFDVKEKTGLSALQIDFGPAGALVDVDPAATFSTHVERRTIFDNHRKPVGQDTWGYLSSGERWRRVHLKGFAHLKYGLVQANEAERFDQVISSACLVSGS